MIELRLMDVLGAQLYGRPLRDQPYNSYSFYYNGSDTVTLRFRQEDQALYTGKEASYNTLATAFRHALEDLVQAQPKLGGTFTVTLGDSFTGEAYSSGVAYKSSKGRIIEIISNTGTISPGYWTCTEVPPTSVIAEAINAADPVNLNTSSYVKGELSSATISGGEFQYVYGKTSSILIDSGGYQDVYPGGITISTTINSGGSQNVWHTGTANLTTINKGGSQSIYDRGVASSTTIKSGSQSVYSGGIASLTSIKKGGAQTVFSGGIARLTTVNSGGQQVVSKGGSARFTTVGKGGTLMLQNGGTVYGAKIKSGAKETVVSGATDTAASVAGTLTVNGKTSRTVVTSGGTAIVTGTITKAEILEGGSLMLNDTAVASGVTLSGGKCTVTSSATIKKASVEDGGTLTLNKGASASAFTLKTNGTLKIASGNTLNGKNTFTGATATGGTAKKRVSLGKDASLTVGTKTIMKNLHLNASNATLKATGTGNTLGSLLTNKNTDISYDVSKLTGKDTAYMLTLSAKNTQKLGTFSINVKKGQGLGVYELSKNISQAKNTPYTINMANKKQGVAKLNGLGLIQGTAIYTVSDVSNKISLTVAKTGKTLKGTAKDNKLTGTANWDVFYGGKGNDTITGQNGQDVAVYDKTAWGKDVIAKTSGSMTLLFKDLKASDIVQKTSGSDMIITRKNDSSQKITVTNWNDSTHSIVYDNNMTAFDKFLSVASPSTKQTAAARNEAFKKAGLASA